MSASSQFKQAIAKQVSQLTNCSPQLLTSLIRVPKVQAEGPFSISIPKLKAALEKQIPAPNVQSNPAKWCNELAQKFKPDTLIKSATPYGTNLHFDVDRAEFTQRVLQQVHSENSCYGWGHVEAKEKKPLVIIDYSSPNIAKPFHAGHLRSTILGNFAKRIHNVMGYETLGINYLGDWGKQYGLLAIGFERYGKEQDLKSDPIHHLYEVYVKINEDANLDPEIHTKANAYFKRMEEGDKEALAQWKRFRDMSIDSYASIYKRLDIEFDVYSGESQVNDYIPKVYDLLRSRNLLTKTEGGSLAIDLENHDLGVPVVQRADGTSLYLTRDLASILMRREKYAFDKAIYVVGEEQNRYLKQVFKTAELLFGDKQASPWANNLHHLGFGRINGMSTRKGTVVFLQDILDTAKESVLEYMHKDSTKYDALEGVLKEDKNSRLEDVADKVGVSAILVQDMKSKRVKNYNFAWDRMTDSRGDTGVFLQYAHARACGIERKANIGIHVNCDYRLLKEREAFELAQVISHFPDQVESSFNTLEPSTIVNYLFKLSHATSTASAALRVKGSDAEVAKARMLLFWSAKTTLANGMGLLGIKALEQM
ncbi:arginyl-tRNA synthetase [Phycomyces nitens]|nr:arginyl-tRNA synthetase [Phycomyces nitens]